MKMKALQKELSAKGKFTSLVRFGNHAVEVYIVGDKTVCISENPNYCVVASETFFPKSKSFSSKKEMNQLLCK